VREAPHHQPVRRLDEVRAAKNPIVKYGFGAHRAPEPAATEPRQLETQRGA